MPRERTEAGTDFQLRLFLWCMVVLVIGIVSCIVSTVTEIDYLPIFVVIFVATLCVTRYVLYKVERRPEAERISTEEGEVNA